MDPSRIRGNKPVCQDPAAMAVPASSEPNNEDSCFLLSQYDRAGYDDQCTFQQPESARHSRPSKTLSATVYVEQLSHSIRYI